MLPPARRALAPTAGAECALIASGESENSASGPFGKFAFRLYAVIIV